MILIAAPLSSSRRVTGKADIIFFAGSAVIIAEVGYSIYAVGQAYVDYTLIHIRNFAGISALDSALFQVVMIGVLGYALDICLHANGFQAGMIYAVPIVRFC